MAEPKASQVPPGLAKLLRAIGLGPSKVIMLPIDMVDFDCDACPDPCANPESGFRDEPVTATEVCDLSNDPWAHRSAGMRCATCMWFVEKAGPFTTNQIGRCRRHAPTMNGYPVVFAHDWCGDHKLDETKGA